MQPTSLTQTGYCKTLGLEGGARLAKTYGMAIVSSYLIPKGKAQPLSDLYEAREGSIMLAATAYVYSRPQRENHSACLPVCDRSCRWRSHNQAAAGTDKERLALDHSRRWSLSQNKEQRAGPGRTVSQILPLKQMIHSILSGEDRSRPPNMQGSPF